MISNLHILIVEDESLLALDLSMQLKSKGYDVVDYVTNTKQAVESFEKYPHINLLLMDIHLNETTDGIDLYKQLPHNLPVIYLTAFTDDATINKAVATHPLGYLVKPLHKQELFALLKLASLQHTESLQNTQTIIQLPNNYAFDTINEILTQHDQHIKIGGKKLQLLKLLIEAKGDFVPFHFLENTLYRDNPPGESSLRTLIYRLRSDLANDMIETERTYGIRLKMIN